MPFAAGNSARLYEEFYMTSTDSDRRGKTDGHLPDQQREASPPESAQVAALRQAAATATPFCAICDKRLTEIEDKQA
ncbi:MAG: hypothetical protein ACK5S1_02690 [bacterium]